MLVISPAHVFHSPEDVGFQTDDKTTNILQFYVSKTFFMVFSMETYILKNNNIYLKNNNNQII